MKDLISNYLKAKADEDAAHEKRVAAEEDIAESMDLKPEGTTTLKTDGYKVSVTTKLTRTLDYERYQEQRFESGFVDMKPTINLTKLRAVSLTSPERVAACITVKPAKTSVKVEVSE